jgi:RNA polymerase sigma factor (sigma-70 family)
MKDEEARPKLLISPIDKDGKPVDGNLIQMANKAWPTILAIGRKRQLCDVSSLSEITERVVHAASRRLERDKDASIGCGYIVTSCKNAMKQFAKQARRLDQKSSEEFDREIDLRSVNWVAGVDRDLLIDQLLAKLDQRQKNLVLLKLEGEPFDYIASVLGISVGSARVLFSKTLKLLRQIVNDEAQRSRTNRKSQSA